MTSSVSEVDDLLAEQFPPLSPGSAGDLLPPGVDEPTSGDGGSGLGALLGGAGGGREGVQLGGARHLRHHRLLRGKHFRGHGVCACCGEQRTGGCWF